MLTGHKRAVLDVDGNFGAGRNGLWQVHKYAKIVTVVFTYDCFRLQGIGQEQGLLGHEPDGRWRAIGEQLRLEVMAESITDVREDLCWGR